MYRSGSNVYCTCVTLGRWGWGGTGWGNRVGGVGGGATNWISLFSLGMSSYSLSQCSSPSTFVLLCLITASPITHPCLRHPSSLHHFLHFASDCSSSFFYFLSSFPAPHHLFPSPALLPLSSPPSLRISRPSAGTVVVVSCCASVCRPLFTPIIGIGSVLFGFHVASTETSLNQSSIQCHVRPNYPTSSSPRPPYLIPQTIAAGLHCVRECKTHFREHAGMYKWTGGNGCMILKKSIETATWIRTHTTSCSLMRSQEKKQAFINMRRGVNTKGHPII